MSNIQGGGSSPSPSKPTPRPRSPPEIPDFGGKRKRMAKLQKLEREIGILQKELKWVGELQPASKSCKEVADFVGTKSEPLMPTKHRNNKRRSFWGWLCGMAYLNPSCPCCSCHSECSCHVKCPACCTACPSCSGSMFRCSSSCCCCGNVSCRRKRCISGLTSCEDCWCCRTRGSCFSCPKMGQCCCSFSCRNLCHNSSH